MLRIRLGLGSRIGLDFKLYADSNYENNARVSVRMKVRFSDNAESK